MGNYPEASAGRPSSAGTWRLMPRSCREGSGSRSPQRCVTGSVAHGGNGSSGESEFSAGSLVTRDTDVGLLRSVSGDCLVVLAGELSFQCGFSKWLEEFRKQESCASLP